VVRGGRALEVREGVGGSLGDGWRREERCLIFIAEGKTVSRPGSSTRIFVLAWRFSRLIVMATDGT
jgi:hypothetical protein